MRVDSRDSLSNAKNIARGAFSRLDGQIHQITEHTAVLHIAAMH